MKLRKKHKNILVGFLGTAIVILLLYYLSGLIDKAAVGKFILSFGIWAPVIFIFIFFITIIIPPLNSTPLLIVGYFLFDKNVQVYAYLATIIGSIANFVIAKRWGRGLVVKLVGGRNIGKIDRISEKYGLKSLIFFRFFQSHLSDFISYAYGLTKMDFLPYFLVSIIAPLPLLLIWQFIFFRYINNVATYLAFHMLIFLFFISVSFVLVVLWRKKIY